MKIRTVVTVDVDPNEWVDASGCDRADVRGNVVAYVRESLQSAPMFSEDTDAEVTVR